ncbi:MAG: hypothetical protein QW727_02900 [Candidatus Pacearchaeota archaeon]
MVEIIPTIFATSKRMFDEKFNKLVPISKKLQVDFMDGHFVTKKSIKLSNVPNLRNYKVEFEAHLMVRNPRSWIKRLKNKGFKKVIFHYPTTQLSEDKVKKLVNDIHKLDMEAFIAISPEVREDEVFPFLNYVEGILIMGVNPGREKQHLLHKTYYKLQNLRKLNKRIPLQVDGGVNPHTIKDLVDAGATIINSGSFVSRSDNPKQALKGLYDALKT